MAGSRTLRGDDVIHVSLVSPTGELSQVEAPISLDEIADYIIARMAALKGEEVAAEAPSEGGAL